MRADPLRGHLLRLTEERITVEQTTCVWLKATCFDAAFDVTHGGVYDRSDGEENTKAAFLQNLQISYSIR